MAGKKHSANAATTEATVGKKAVTAASKKPAPAKAAAGGKQKGEKTSALTAAARILKEDGAPMTCKELIAAMATKGYWTSPGGKTPEATLYSAILRELKVKGKEARFCKTARGKFALAAAG